MNIPPAGVSFTSTSPENVAALREFLNPILTLPADAPNFSDDALAWKYFNQHPWWPGSRSYVLQVPAGIAAHLCVTPVRFEVEGRIVESFQFIDWAAGRFIPAAGLLLFRRCLEFSKGTSLAIGGTTEAQSVIQKMRGFTRKDDMMHYAKPLRPSRHLAQSPKEWKSVARFGRNLYWRTMPGWPDSKTWTCRAAGEGENIFGNTGPFVPILRTRPWFDYLLDCPIVKTELVILEQACVARGHAFLAHVDQSVRVADFAVAGPATTSERVAAFAALMRHIDARPESAEIVAASSLPEMCRVFAECGLRPRGSWPVYLADPHKLLPPELPLEITPLIGDAFYLSSPGYPFVC